MKKLLLLVVLSLAVLTLCGRVVPVHAAEEAAKGDAKGGEKAEDSKDKESEGGEEGAKKDSKEGNKEGKKDKDVSGGKFAGDPIYVRMQPFTLPVIQPNGVEQLVTVQLAVEVKDFEASDNMHANMPRVLDALNQALYGSLSDGTIQTGKMVNVDKLKARATGALQKLLGPDTIKEVLVINLSQRMLK